MSGPSKIPRHLKLLRGTLQPCRDTLPAGPGLPAIEGETRPPAWMQDVSAVAEFRRLSSALVANKMLTQGNVVLLAHLCMLHARLQEAWVSDSTPTAALLTVYRRLSGDLGLTGMAAQSTVTKPDNKFTNNKPR